MFSKGRTKLILPLLLVIISLVLFITVFNVKPNEVVCKESKRGTPYCMYNGEIKGVYLNKKDGLILIFLDSKIKAEDASGIGYTVEDSNAVAISLSKDFEFATLTFDVLNEAFINGSDVKIHARGVYKGYLLIDRVWVNK